jgi:hypothetical protein
MAPVNQNYICVRSKLEHILWKPQIGDTWYRPFTIFLDGVSFGHIQSSLSWAHLYPDGVLTQLLLIPKHPNQLSTLDYGW